MPKRTFLPLLPVLRTRQPEDMKKRIATARFHVQRRPFVYLFIFFFLIILAFTTFLRSFFSISFPSTIILTSTSKRQASSSSEQDADPCLHTIPEKLLYFDSPTSGAASKTNSTSTYLFSAFFDHYLFSAASDVVLSLNSTPSLLHSSDVQKSLQLSKVYLPQFYSDPTLILDNYTLGYVHVDRRRGIRHILHTNSHNATYPEMRHSVVIHRHFDATCQILIHYYPPSLMEDPIYIVLPYSARPRRLSWFLEQFTELVSESDVNARLIVAIFNKNTTDIEHVKKLISSYSSSSAKQIKLLPVNGDSTGFFSRAMAIQDASRYVPENSIMFISDIDMFIFPTLFESCRFNVIQSSQVFFPVFYSLYPRNERIMKSGGYWRDSSLGMSCMYRSDFDNINAYGSDTSSKFIGWGMEDRALHEAFLRSSKYEVFRAVEPALRHKWHVKHCELLTSAYEDCLAVTFQQLGDMKSVGRFMLDRGMDPQMMFAAYAEDDEDDELKGKIVKGADNSTSGDKEELRRKNLLLEKNEERKKRILDREKQKDQEWREKHGIHLAEDEATFKQKLREQHMMVLKLNMTRNTTIVNDEVTELNNQTEEEKQKEDAEDRKQMLRDQEMIKEQEKREADLAQKTMGQWGALLNKSALEKNEEG